MCRLVENAEPRVRQEPPGERDLLLVAAREQSDGLFGIRCTDFERVDFLCDFATLEAGVDNAKLRPSRQVWQADVLSYGVGQKEAFATPVRREVNDASPDRRRGIGNGHALAVQEYFAACRLQPEQGPHDGLLPASGDAPEADDLASADLE